MIITPPYMNRVAGAASPTKPSLALMTRAYLGREAGGTIVDSSPNAADVALTGTNTTGNDAFFGRDVVNFAGSVGIELGVSIPLATEFTVACWAKRNSSGEQRFIAINPTVSPSVTMKFPDAGGVEMSAVNSIRTEAGVTATNWNHFAIRGTNPGGQRTVEYFVNGVRTHIETFTIGNQAGGTSYFGASRSNSFVLDGNAVDLIVAGELTDGEIAWLANPANDLLAP